MKAMPCQRSGNILSCLCQTFIYVMCAPEELEFIANLQHMACVSDHVLQDFTLLLSQKNSGAIMIYNMVSDISSSEM